MSRQPGYWEHFTAEDGLPGMRFVPFDLDSLPDEMIEAAARTFALHAGWTWPDAANNDPGFKARNAADAVLRAALSVELP